MQYIFLLMNSQFSTSKRPISTGFSFCYKKQIHMSKDEYRHRKYFMKIYFLILSKHCQSQFSTQLPHICNMLMEKDHRQHGSNSSNKLHKHHLSTTDSKYKGQRERKTDFCEKHSISEYCTLTCFHIAKELLYIKNQILMDFRESMIKMMISLHICHGKYSS